MGQNHLELVALSVALFDDGGVIFGDDAEV